MHLHTFGSSREYQTFDDGFPPNSFFSDRFYSQSPSSLPLNNSSFAFSSEGRSTRYRSSYQADPLLSHFDDPSPQYLSPDSHSYSSLYSGQSLSLPHPLTAHSLPRLYSRFCSLLFISLLTPSRLSLRRILRRPPRLRVLSVRRRALLPPLRPGPCNGPCNGSFNGSFLGSFNGSFFGSFGRQSGLAERSLPRRRRFPPARRLRRRDRRAARRPRPQPRQKARQKKHRARRPPP